jgi:hypothetical protein
MGGNALKSIVTERQDKHQFIKTYCSVTQKLIEEMNIHPIDIRLIDYYREKADFGDMDLIIAKEYKDSTFLERLKKVFEPKEVYPNTDVYSFDYKNFQIDLIFIEREFLQISTTYYNYNDLGNLMGRVSEKMGVRYGHGGLIFEYFNHNRSQKLDVIKLSIDPRQIFEYLGYDFDRYLLGFQNLEEIFEYIVSSKYFNPSYFAYSSLNHQNRTRNKKRKTYQQFLYWLETKKFLNLYEPNDAENLKLMIEAFPHSKIRMEQLNKEVRRKDIIKNKFNGNIVKDLIPGIDFKRIATVITKFNELYNEDFIEKSTQNKINAEILKINESV